MRILLIEDDPLIGDGLKIGLTKSGFGVDWFTNGADGEEALLQSAFDAVVLDLSLPEIDGLDILQNWRNKGRKEPVLILTARGDVDERIKGLNAGADDYLPKPFALGEVVARLNALLRRRGGETASLINYRQITFNLQTKQTFLNDKEVVLAPKETALLELLLLNRNRVLSKEKIEEKLYSWDDDVSSNAVEVHIHHLRKKLGKNIIKTVNKIGYMMEDV